MLAPPGHTPCLGRVEPSVHAVGGFALTAWHGALPGWAVTPGDGCPDAGWQYNGGCLSANLLARWSLPRLHLESVRVGQPLPLRPPGAHPSRPGARAGGVRSAGLVARHAHVRVPA